MVLSTVNSEGQPSSRVVLLKSFGKQGFVFYTNYQSRKATQIVCIQGTAEKHSTEAADEYFASRPRGSQISAAASDQSTPIDSRESLEKRFKDLGQQFDGTSVPRPENWGGYLVKPTSIEFWQGQPNRLHDRLVYSRRDDQEEANWRIERLSP
ncbi:UNVERIFIED_CONTAM: hypothetical protein GTU68_056057 [Idotea baltica]|nr:hypothetical protein [Idotea baltica]